MKKLLVLLIVAALATVSQAAVLAYEGFGDSTGGTLDGYSGTSPGLSGAWVLSGGTNQYVKVTPTYEYASVSGGYAAETTGGNQHWWEKNNQWWTSQADRSLSNSIDLTVDGTIYMSFFSMAGHPDYVGQMGLNDGTNELMWGNGYNGTGKGLTAYYGAIGTDPTTNADGTGVAYGNGTQYETGFYVARLVKSDSGVTDALAVDIMFYNLTTTSGVIDNSDPGVWTRSVSLTGVSSVFGTLELKLDGGGNWPSIDEVRIGENWADVTGIPEPATLSLLGLGVLAMLRKRK